MIFLFLQCIRTESSPCPFFNLLKNVTMKQFLIIALLCIFGYTAHAQPKIVNNTNCNIRVTALCYDPNTCMQVSTCGTFLVPAGTTLPLPTCVCPMPMLQGYTVCRQAAGCGPVCVSVGDAAGPWPCPAYPPSNNLPPCGPCMAVGAPSVSYDAAGNLIVQ